MSSFARNVELRSNLRAIVRSVALSLLLAQSFAVNVVLKPAELADRFDW
jgi:hypothetical protein